MFTNKQDFLDVAKLMVENKGNGFPNILLVIAPPGHGVIYTLEEADFGEQFIDINGFFGFSAQFFESYDENKLYVVRRDANDPPMPEAFVDRTFVFEAKFDTTVH